MEERLERRRTWFSRHPADNVVLRFYRYNARVPGWGRGRGMIFRDNGPHEDHNRFLYHVHRFDTLGTGAEIKPPAEIPKDQVPTLRQVLKEAEEWYYAHLVHKAA